MEPNTSPVGAASSFSQRFVIDRERVAMQFGRIGVADVMEASSTLALGVGSCLTNANESRDLLQML
jgi:hypothetical protein